MRERFSEDGGRGFFGCISSLRRHRGQRSDVDNAATTSGDHPFCRVPAERAHRFVHDHRLGGELVHRGVQGGGAYAESGAVDKHVNLAGFQFADDGGDAAVGGEIGWERAGVQLFEVVLRAGDCDDVVAFGGELLDERPADAAGGAGNEGAGRGGAQLGSLGRRVHGLDLRGGCGVVLQRYGEWVRIVTWNVNSVRARAERIGLFLDRSDVDVLAIQELKCKDAQFPAHIFEDRGYQVAFHGLNQWNGVAVASRVGLDDVEVGFEGVPGFGDDDQVEARAISAVTGDVRTYSLYVPNGRELDHPHYTYKLEWLAQLRNEALARLDQDVPFVMCGDFNVAPLDEDVWDMAAFEGATHVSQPERDAFNDLISAGLTEVTRQFTPGPGVYTFWDYQQLRFPKKQGMRIDFQLASPNLAERATDAFIDREERKGKGASDHAPVWVDYQL